MSLKNNVFTVKEIATHFLNQVSAADAEFQVNQREAWQQLAKDDDLYVGFAKSSSLFLNEMDPFEITPTSFSYLERLKMFFGSQLKSEERYYTMAKTSESIGSNLKITVTIKRESPGKYNSDITTTPETPLKSEEINVIGFSK